MSERIEEKNGDLKSLSKGGGGGGGGVLWTFACNI